MSILLEIHRLFLRLRQIQYSHMQANYFYLSENHSFYQHSERCNVIILFRRKMLLCCLLPVIISRMILSKFSQLFSGYNMIYGLFSSNKGLAKFHWIAPPFPQQCYVMMVGRLLVGAIYRQLWDYQKRSTWYKKFYAILEDLFSSTYFINNVQ